MTTLDKYSASKKTPRGDPDKITKEIQETSQGVNLSVYPMVSQFRLS